MTTLTQLPIIDLSRADPSAGPGSAEALRADLLAAAHDVGFFYLTGHGITAAQQAELFSVAGDFFALPEEQKRAIENVHSPHFRGWTRLGGERTQGQQDWREQIDIGPERAAQSATADTPWAVLEGPNLWPSDLPRFREVVESWTSAVSGVAVRLLQEWAQALGQDRHVFDAAFDEPSTLLKIVRYPGRDPEASGSTQGVGAHKDSGVLTLLLVEPGKAGLQVEHHGSWIDAPPVEDAFIVNIGELLEVATDGYLKATVHRVVTPPAGQTRVSVPFFFNPNLSARIPRLTLPPALAREATGVTVDADNPIHETYGANALKSRLRAHPDVAALQHPELVAAR